MNCKDCIYLRYEMSHDIVTGHSCAFTNEMLENLNGCDSFTKCSSEKKCPISQQYCMESICAMWVDRRCGFIKVVRRGRW